jgi:hypothetical protein
MDQERLEAALAANDLPDLQTLIDDLDFASGFSKLLNRERSDEQCERMDRLLTVVKKLGNLGLYDDVLAVWRGRP